MQNERKVFMYATMFHCMNPISWLFSAVGKVILFLLGLIVLIIGIILIITVIGMTVGILLSIIGIILLIVALSGGVKRIKRR